LVAAVAEPNRRRLLQLLGAGEQTVSQLASHFTVSCWGPASTPRCCEIADLLTVKWLASSLTVCSPAAGSSRAGGQENSSTTA
jgi:DNA-binding transcriptional ArsR family regulator